MLPHQQRRPAGPMAVTRSTCDDGRRQACHPRGAAAALALIERAPRTPGVAAATRAARGRGEWSGPNGSCGRGLPLGIAACWGGGLGWECAPLTAAAPRSRPPERPVDARVRRPASPTPAAADRPLAPTAGAAAANGRLFSPLTFDAGGTAGRRGPPPPPLPPLLPSRPEAERGSPPPPSAVLGLAGRYVAPGAGGERLKGTPTGVEAAAAPAGKEEWDMAPDRADLGAMGEEAAEGVPSPESPLLPPPPPLRGRNESRRRGRGVIEAGRALVMRPTGSSELRGGGGVWRRTSANRRKRASVKRHKALDGARRAERQPPDVSSCPASSE